MADLEDLPVHITHQVRDACLCLHLQRAARVVARRYDEALRPAGLVNTQFSLLMALNRPGTASPGSVAKLLGMDRTTLTANLKPLQRRGLVSVTVDPGDRRGRRLALTAAGRALLAEALPLWRQAQAASERLLRRTTPESLRGDLIELA